MELDDLISEKGELEMDILRYIMHRAYDFERKTGASIANISFKYHPVRELRDNTTSYLLHDCNVQIIYKSIRLE